MGLNVSKECGDHSQTVIHVVIDVFFLIFLNIDLLATKQHQRH